MNEGLIAFPSLGLRFLSAPAKGAHDPPDMSGVVENAGDAGDHLGDPGQAPEVCVKAVGARTFEKSLFYPLKLRCGQLGLAPRASSCGQGLGAIFSPRDKPDVSRLARHTQLTRNLGLRNALGKKSGSSHSTLLHAGEITAGTVTIDLFCFHAYYYTHGKGFVKLLCEIQ